MNSTEACTSRDSHFFRSAVYLNIERAILLLYVLARLANYHTCTAHNHFY